MKVAEHTAAVNLAKLNLATKLVREVLTSLEYSAKERNAIITPLAYISRGLRDTVDSAMHDDCTPTSIDVIASTMDAYGIKPGDDRVMAADLAATAVDFERAAALAGLTVSIIKKRPTLGLLRTVGRWITGKGKGGNAAPSAADEARRIKGDTK